MSPRRPASDARIGRGCGSAWRWSWMVLAGAALGCGAEATKDDGGGDGADTASEAVDPACVDQPVVTWANFGAGFLLEQCQSCHAATSPDRRGAPADVHFGEELDVVRLRDRIAARALGDPPTMPPEGGVSDSDRALLAVWITCDPALQPGGR